MFSGFFPIGGFVGGLLGDYRGVYIRASCFEDGNNDNADDRREADDYKYNHT